MNKRQVIVRVLLEHIQGGGCDSSLCRSSDVFFSSFCAYAGRMLRGLAFVLAFLSSALTARANVYATDIKLNGSQNAGVVVPGSSLIVSYILNDTATGGVWVRVYSGTNVVQTLSSAAGQAGTNTGLNTAIWSNTPALTEGVYSVSITAASTGYATWTNITDASTNYYVNFPTGIAVNQDTNSLYYGRVYVANGYPGPGNALGDQVGILKYNADGSPADEGGFSTGGYGWAGNQGSPWKLAIGADDRLYVDDYASQGVVVSFDPTIDAGSVQYVIRTDNYPQPTVYFTGLSVVGSGTNMEVWMTDAELSGSVGVVGWQIGAYGVAATNDPGFVIVPVNSYLSQSPCGLAVGTNGSIDVIQQLASGNPDLELLNFPPYHGTPETSVTWADVMYPQLLEAYGVAVDATATRLAVAVVGESDDFEYDTTGGLYLFNATNGDSVVDVDQSGGDGYFDAAWDQIGNLYALDNSMSAWRVYSPPGTNQAITVAVPVVQAYNSLVAPTLANPSQCSGGLGFVLEGQSNVTYIIQCSSDLTLTNWPAVQTNFSNLPNRPICVSIGGAQEFYRAVASP
jgi:hypothetical protein